MLEGATSSSSPPQASHQKNKLVMSRCVPFVPLLWLCFGFPQSKRFAQDKGKGRL